MKASEFLKVISTVNTLNHHQRTLLLKALEHSSDELEVSELIETHFDTKKCCPHCLQTQIYRHGMANGLQRYRCRSCHKTFNALTKTPLAHLRHKSKWLAYLKEVAQSVTVRTAAYNVGVHRNTTFRWRHRFLAWIKLDCAFRLHGITEADEMYLPESFKGSRKLKRPPRKHGSCASKRGLSKEQVCILIARDRSKQTLDFVTGKGSITKMALACYLKPALDSDVLLVSDSNLSYDAFCKAEHISHTAINLSQGQRVNGAYHSRFKEWLKRFHGVATKYLPNYLGWCRMMDEYKKISPELLLNSSFGNFQHLTVT